MKKSFTAVVFSFAFLACSGQIDSTLLRRTSGDTTRVQLNMDAIYARPFLTQSPVAVGGYVEANWQHLGTDGMSEGHQFQMRRLTLFIAASVYKRIRFLSEIEFEDGTKEINIEFASIDVAFHPLFNVRAGVIMNPIGAFNQNHDGPRWEFVDRPASATEMLPATWSNVGVGAYGKQFRNDWVYAYEVYLTNGFDDAIIANTSGKTFLPAAKLNADRFEESFNGVPLLTAKVALRHMSVGELGLSYMGGVYNRFREDRLAFDKKRWLHVFAVDFNSAQLSTGTRITGEWAWVLVDVPPAFSQQFGSQQRGGYADLVQPVFKGAVLGFERTVINAAVRMEYVDWNNGSFRETGANIREDLISLTPGISWRPGAQTVFRLNYRYSWLTDIFGNRPSRTGGFQVGFASYF